MPNLYFNINGVKYEWPVLKGDPGDGGKDGKGFTICNTVDELRGSGVIMFAYLLFFVRQMGDLVGFITAYFNYIIIGG